MPRSAGDRIRRTAVAACRLGSRVRLEASDLLNRSNMLRQASYDRNAPIKDEHRAQAQAAIDEAQARYAAAKAKA